MYNIVYAGKDKKPIRACPKNCPVCKEWRKPHQSWKIFEFSLSHTIPSLFTTLTEFKLEE